RRRSLQASGRGSRIVLDGGLSSLHAARDHALERPRPGRQRSPGGARQLQDRRATLQHGNARLQEVPQLPPQARVPAAVPRLSRRPLLVAATSVVVNRGSAPDPGSAPLPGRRAVRAYRVKVTAALRALPAAACALTVATYVPGARALNKLALSTV